MNNSNSIKELLKSSAAEHELYQSKKRRLKNQEKNLQRFLEKNPRPTFELHGASNAFRQQVVEKMEFTVHGQSLCAATNNLQEEIVEGVEVTFHGKEIKELSGFLQKKLKANLEVTIKGQGINGALENFQKELIGGFELTASSQVLLQASEDHWKEKIRELEMTVKALRSNLQQKEAELLAQKEQIRLAQERAFRNSQASRGIPLDDTEVSRRLAALENGVRSWAKVYSSSAFSDPQRLSDAALSTLAEKLGELLGVDGPMTGMIKELSKCKEKMPFLLIQTILSTYVFRHLVASPFHLFKKSQFEETVSPGELFGRRLDNLYDDFRTVDETEAHLWRCQTVQLAGGIISRDHTENRDVTTRKNLCEIIAADITSTLNGLVDYEKLTSQRAEESRRDLIKLLISASDLSTKLWTQRTHLHCVWFNGGDFFQVCSDVMSAHRLQKLDSDDTRMDGHEILFTIQPAIIACGNADGECYNVDKVWLKSIVFVLE